MQNLNDKEKRIRTTKYQISLKIIYTNEHYEIADIYAKLLNPFIVNEKTGTLPNKNPLHPFNNGSRIMIAITFAKKQR